MSVLKFIFSLILILSLFLSCEDIKRDNLLDPKVEDGYRASMVLVEAFVNVSHYTDYNRWAIEGLNRLSAVYGDKITIAQYHRNIDTVYVEDPSFTSEELSQKSLTLHDLYVSEADENQRYLPDIFVNGAFDRVSGASSALSVEQRVSEVIESKINLKNKFTLEPQVVQISSQTYDINCRIARLGNQAMAGYKLKMIAVYDNNHPLGKQVVVDFDTSEEIEQIEAGSYKTISLGQKQFNYAPDAIIFSVCSENELESFQSVRWEAP